MIRIHKLGSLQLVCNMEDFIVSTPDIPTLADELGVLMPNAMIMSQGRRFRGFMGKLLGRIQREMKVLFHLRMMSDSGELDWWMLGGEGVPSPVTFTLD